MSTNASSDTLGRIEFLAGTGGLPKIAIQSPWSTAEIYLHGAQVTHFQKHGEAPFLFLSASSRFENNAPIRGGIPICFPWFGPKGGVEGQPMHGFARIRDWQLQSTEQKKDGQVIVTLQWSDQFEADQFKAQFVVTIGQSLSTELTITNLSNKEFSYEECLHTYFQVGAIDQVSINGLKGATYLDKTDNYAAKLQTVDPITIDREVDRTYLNTASSVTIKDRKLNRNITVAKENSLTTVVWNPWIERARQMADLGDDEYKTMVCVESGNAGENKIKLAPGKTHSLKVQLSSEKLS